MIGRLAGAAALGALAMAVVAQAGAQTPSSTAPAEIMPKQVTPPNVEALKEGMKVVHEAGECSVTFVVSKTGSVKDPKADCTIPEMAPYALKAMEPVTYTPYSFDGFVSESEEITVPFKWAASAAPGTPPTLVKDIDNRAIDKAMQKVKQPGKCDATFTVGLDGKPKNIVPNCTPPAYNDPVSKAIADMVYKPGASGGKPVETANFKFPLNLSTH